MRRRAKIWGEKVCSLVLALDLFEEVRCTCCTQFNMRERVAILCENTRLDDTQGVRYERVWYPQMAVVRKRGLRLPREGGNKQTNKQTNGRICCLRVLLFVFRQKKIPVLCSVRTVYRYESITNERVFFSFLMFLLWHKREERWRWSSIYADAKHFFVTEFNTEGEQKYLMLVNTLRLPWVEFSRNTKKKKIPTQIIGSESSSAPLILYS